MAKRKVLDDLTVAEMRNMRNLDGLSNAEIAQRLDISVPTVYRYIGPRRAQPDEANRSNAQRSERVWDAAHSLTRLEAGSRVYDVNLYTQQVALNIPTLIGAEDVHRMINELTYIEQIMTKWRSEHA